MTITQQLPEVRIKVNGRPIKKYTEPNGNIWVESRDNSNYSIEVKNNNSSRILAVISVDGINIITGKEAKLKPEDGYIINAYSKLDANGWRVSNEKEKSFYFSVDKEKSYAVKLGKGSKNLGVIGVAFYSEKQEPITTNTVYYPYYVDDYKKPFEDQWTCSDETYNTTEFTLTSNNVTLDGAISQSGYISDVINTTAFRGMSTGTGKGEEIESRVTEIGFDVGDFLGTTSIYYDSMHELKAKGIIQEHSMPQPFKNERFCPDIP